MAEDKFYLRIVEDADRNEVILQKAKEVICLFAWVHTVPR